MSQCYDIELLVKLTDEKAALAAMHDKILRAEEEFINYNIPDFTARGIDIESVFGLLRVIFADWPRNCYEQVEKDDGFTLITNAFNASSGWDGTMCDFFELLAPFLADGSSLDIYPDRGHYGIHVIDGKFIYH